MDPNFLSVTKVSGQTSSPAMLLNLFFTLAILRFVPSSMSLVLLQPSEAPDPPVPPDPPPLLSCRWPPTRRKLTTSPQPPVSASALPAEHPSPLPDFASVVLRTSRQELVSGECSTIHPTRFASPPGISPSSASGNSNFTGGIPKLRKISDHPPPLFKSTACTLIPPSRKLFRWEAPTPARFQRPISFIFDAPKTSFAGLCNHRIFSSMVTLRHLTEERLLLLHRHLSASELLMGQNHFQLLGFVSPVFKGHLHSHAIRFDKSTGSEAGCSSEFTDMSLRVVPTYRCISKFDHAILEYCQFTGKLAIFELFVWQYSSYSSKLAIFMLSLNAQS